MVKRVKLLVCGLVLGFWFIGAGYLFQAEAQKFQDQVPLGLIPRIWPEDNPYSPAKADLGRLLFFDKRLSADDTVSCADCHSPQFAFTDGQATSAGIRGQHGNRSAPTVINRAYSLAQFWDGRAPTLEEQAKGPIANPIEMGNTHEAVVEKIKAIAGYRPLFKQAFGTDEITLDHIAKAIATFERTILSGNSPFDRYKAGNKTALNPSAQRGLAVFFNKAKCDQCHLGINFTDGGYYNLGVSADKLDQDPGRYGITKRDHEKGAYKTPTLREVANTAPYMHDGSLATLETVVEFYNKGERPNQFVDERMKPLNLTDAEKTDLVEFLKALSGEGWQHIKPPPSFPK